MSFRETAPPVQNRSRQFENDSAPRAEHREPRALDTGSAEVDSLVVPDPFASAFAPDPFPRGAPTDRDELTSGGGTLFERYQKLFATAESARDHESAILAALDSAILGARPASLGGRATGSLPSAATAHRPRLRSFHFERDVDWSEEPPDAFDPAHEHESNGETSAARESVTSFAPLPLASEVPVVFDGAPPEPAFASAAKAPKRTLFNYKLTPSSFGRWVVAALVVGFGLGFLLGRGEDEPGVAGGPTKAAALTPEPATIPEAARATEPTPVPEPDHPLAQANAVNATSSPAEATPSQAPSESNASPTPPKAKVASEHPGFDTKGALRLLTKAGARAGVCVPPGEPGGSVVATVTFSRKGHVEDVALSNATFGGSYSSDCIKGALSSVRVQPFFGPPVSVKKTLVVR